MKLRKLRKLRNQMRNPMRKLRNSVRKMRTPMRKLLNGAWGKSAGCSGPAQNQLLLADDIAPADKS